MRRQEIGDRRQEIGNTRQTVDCVRGLICHLAVVICYLSFFNFKTVAAEPETKPLFTILYTAEAHAALLPCDCPLQPLGGVARRATLIKRYRERGPVILLDGGGWAAGGIYDEDSDGDAERDKLRTHLMSEAMKLMKYDAMAMGPTEAKFIKAAADAPSPVATSNALSTKVADTPIVIYGWSEEGVEIFGKNAPAPPHAWHRAADFAKTFIDIHLSRLGEENSEEALKAIGPDIIFVASRKTTQRTSWKSGRVVNFDYQAHNLVVVEVFPLKEKTGRYDFRVHLEPLDKSIPDDPEIAALLAPHLDALKKKGKKTIALEYWMMPDCPGCKLARPELQKLTKELEGRVTITPHWVVEKSGDKLTSLHGDEELNEARVQALLWKYYPERIWEWFEWRAAHRDPWQAGADALHILKTRIASDLEDGEADALLRADFELSERRRVHATPSIVIGNRLFDGDIDRLHLLGALCGQLDEPKPAACKDAPLCFFDAQCRKRGFVAKCIDAGKPGAHCDTTKVAVKVPATVLVDNDALSSNRDTILEALIGDLPGLDYKLVDIATPEGKRLAEQAKVTRLPAYLIDPIAKTEDGYKGTVGRVARDISIQDDKGVETKWLLLREDQFGVGSNRILARPRIKGRADLFVSRFSKNGQEALETALDCAKSRECAGLNLVLHDILYLNDEGKLAAKNGVAEVEEAARAMAARLDYPLKLNAYFIEWGKKRGSSYWDVPLKAVGIDPDKIRAKAENPSTEVLDKLNEEVALLKSLDAGGEI